MQRWLRNRENGSKRKFQLGVRFNYFQLLQPPEYLGSITYSDDNKWLIGAYSDNLIEGRENTLSLWNTTHYSSRNDVKVNNRMALVHSVASHDDLIAVGGQHFGIPLCVHGDPGEVRIVSMHKMEEFELHKFPLPVYAVEFLEPKIMVTACMNTCMYAYTAHAIAQLRDIRTRDDGILIAESKKKLGIRTLNCHPSNSNLVAVGGDDVVAIFDIRKPMIPANQLFDNDSHLHTIRWSPSGKYIATSGMNDISIWNYQESVTKSTPDSQLDDLTFFKQCPWIDEEHVLSCNSDGVFHVWNRKTDVNMKLKPYNRHGYQRDFRLSYNRIHHHLATSWYRESHQYRVGIRHHIGVWSPYEIKQKSDIVSYEICK